MVVVSNEVNIDQQLVVDLRARSKIHAGYDWKILRRAADTIEHLAHSDYTAASVREWLKGQGVRLTPKQHKTLGLEEQAVNS